jgi:hypothetical protein
MGSMIGGDPTRPCGSGSPYFVTAQPLLRSSLTVALRACATPVASTADVTVLEP